jgi:hypothetical protein
MITRCVGGGSLILYLAFVLMLLFYYIAWREMAKLWYRHFKERECEKTLSSGNKAKACDERPKRS